MTDPPPDATITRSGLPPPSSRTGRTWSLPPDLLAEAVRRLRIASLLYAVGYFLAALLEPVLSVDVRATFFGQPVRWIMPLLSIGSALAVAAIVSDPRVAPRTKVQIGLAFEALGSFGIAAIQYQAIASPIRYADLGTWDFGLSWVAIWVVVFSAMVPTPPNLTLAVAGLSVSSVPLIYAVYVAAGVNAPLEPAQFFFSLILPYIIVLVMAYSVSSVVYGLGSEVRRARELGSYRLAEQLGVGGMGEVWRAEHRMLARPAAIKLIRPEVLGATGSTSLYAIRRFEREAQATARLQSVHTVELYDYGRADDGTFYYVMELLDGFDLQRLVERFGPLPPERVLYLLRQACASLAEAHEVGLIHRDIKPANIYVCRRGREVDFVKVLDFGLVKHGGEVREEADQLSGATLVAGGTPAYMSPEQAVGEAAIDGRADLYSLGCVAYWLLTGTAVFAGRTAIETMMMHLNRAPERPSSRIAVPPDLEQIVMACLEKDPELRPATADELAERLAAVRLPGEWTAARARAWWAAHAPAVSGRYPRPTGPDWPG
jgi:hypothetical protein